MKRILVFVTFLVAACTTAPGVGNSSSSDERKEIVGLEEMSLEYIQTLWGTPDANVPAGQGRTVRFKNIRAEDEDPITEKVEVKYCDVRLDINSQQLVQSWQYEGCRDK
ncbi:MAG: hypothetical protein EOP09_11230 [Proteobacteria bacterium]|nr:MAG: hypothetical protein EOP09_11230 [Pseudomonadota bacterium]